MAERPFPDGAPRRRAGRERATDTSPHPAYTDVAAAATRVRGTAARTPLFRCAALDERVGARVYIKPENLQTTGSFKLRGAFNRIASLPAATRDQGVVAYSSGNHAQGVAAAARALGIPAIIVMPEDAPLAKVERTRALGAEIHRHARFFERRERIAADLAATRGATIVPPYDDPMVLAGQGTVGLDIFQDARALGEQLDAVYVCAGGGGLAAGIALAAEGVSPDTALFTCEPHGFDDHARSLALGERVRNEPGATSLCDGLMAPTPGALPFAVAKDRLAGGLAVSEDEICAAVACAFTTLKQVVEPSGAPALAAALTHGAPRNARAIAVVLTGGNVDPGLYRDLLARGGA